MCACLCPQRYVTELSIKLGEVAQDVPDAQAKAAHLVEEVVCMPSSNPS